MKKISMLNYNCLTLIIFLFLLVYNVFFWSVYKADICRKILVNNTLIRFLEHTNISINEPLMENNFNKFKNKGGNTKFFEVNINKYRNK